MGSSGCIVVGRGNVRRFTGCGDKPRKEKGKTPLKLLPLMNANKPVKAIQWFGDRWPNYEERQLFERVFYSQYRVVWPQCQTRWIAPRQLVEQLTPDNDTYLLINEGGLEKYLSKIRWILAERQLICHFVVAGQNSLSAVYTHAVTDKGQSVVWLRWCRPPTRGQLAGGHSFLPPYL